MKIWLGLLAVALAASCDRIDQPESTGRLGDLKLRLSGRYAVSVPESLRVRVVCDGRTSADLSRPLASFGSLDLAVTYGSQVSIQVRLHAAGDTLEAADTTFVMPAVADLRLVLDLRPTLPSGLSWDPSPSRLARVGRAFADTLRIAGAGMDQARIALIQAPAGLALSGGVLAGTPRDTGVFPVKISVARWSRLDTLEWSLAVVSNAAWTTAPKSRVVVGRILRDTLRVSGHGSETAELSLLGAPAGMQLSRTALQWVPTDTGTFPIGLSVANGLWTDTLEWTIQVGAGAGWETPPRTTATRHRPFSDTLRLAGAGMDSAALLLLQSPSGMDLSGNVLDWTPADTGAYTLLLSVSRWEGVDTLEWTIAVHDTIAIRGGMVRIPAAGRTFLFGGGIGLDSGIVPTEVSLANDFDMDVVEVTGTRFDSVMMAKYPKNYWAQPWGGTRTDVPITNIDLTGAILYCNALSQAAGLDTVFQYDQLTWVNWIPSLKNLRVRRDVRGYRLPTEAEWEFAARGGSETLHPWTTTDGASAYANFPYLGGAATFLTVGSLKPNGYGLYDMFGNASEMVLGVFANGWTVPDSQDPWGPGIWSWGGSWRIPVRGGSVSSRLERSSIGTTEYNQSVGFRTVLPVVAQGQGSALPGLVPTGQPTSDTLFTVSADTKIDIPFTLWDLHGETLTLSVSGAGPTISGSSVQWTPRRPQIGTHRFEVTAVAKSSGRVSRPFRIKIQVK